MADIELRCQEIEPNRVQCWQVWRAGSPLTWQQVLQSWQADASLCQQLHECLTQAPFRAYFWECSPLTSATLEREFSFVLVDAPALANVVAEPEMFREHFQHPAANDFAVFPSLGRDAMLLAPVPQATNGDDAHLACYFRRRTPQQTREMWRRLAQAIRDRRRQHPLPLWVSTSGLGVTWLHLRLDSRPKYYTYAPFKSLPPD